ncbi:hypothetical protein RJ640_002132 [Escallonia rubra]|uniref:RsdA/BaiN/AoA(So)-like Rossmann fold-like domain-containing protein n=1 Tax=Escallonia rubra TaxID=112253 RepID=A0AA88U9J3_9ASTE|nr:hypothetical protein RJ640_002132 [Escallonia rubra]
MSFILPRFILRVRVPPQFSSIATNHPCFVISPKRRRFCAFALTANPKSTEQRLVVVGGGAAGVYGAIRAKTLAPNLNVVVIEKGKSLSKSTEQRLVVVGGGAAGVYGAIRAKTLAPNLNVVVIEKGKSLSKSTEQRLVVVGGGAAGVYGAIRAKTLAPNLNVVVIEKGKSLSKSTEQRLVVVGGGAAGVYGAIRAKTLAPNLNVVVIEKGKSLSKSTEQRLVVVGGGAAGVYGAIRAKTLAPNLNVVVIEKGKSLSKALVENYPRGNKELRGSFFNMHGPMDTMSWFSDHGVELKIEEDGRVFPVSNSSSSVIDCLMLEAKKRGVSLQTGKVVTTASNTAGGKFVLKLEKRTIDHVESVEADYLLIASGSSQQGYNLATQLGHSIIKPVPSLFTFKIDDLQLTELSGVTFPKVKAKLKFEAVRKSIPQLTQACFFHSFHMKN